MAEQLLQRKADKYLFDENLCEKIKGIKVINKLRQDIKIQPQKTTPNTPSSSNRKDPLVSQKSTPHVLDIDLNNQRSRQHRNQQRSLIRDRVTTKIAPDIETDPGVIRVKSGHYIGWMTSKFHKYL